MSEPEGKRRRRRPRVALCAAITFDGKLDAAEPLPPALRQALAPSADDVWLIEPYLADQLPPGWEHPARLITPEPSSFPSSSLGTHLDGRLQPPYPASSPEGSWSCPSKCVPKLELGNEGVCRWLCLGGPALFRVLLDTGRVNDLYLLVRPRVDGRRGAPTLGGPFTPEFFLPSIPCRLRRMEVMGGECFLHYTVARRTR